jgi:hypothetical protein
MSLYQEVFISHEAKEEDSGIMRSGDPIVHGIKHGCWIYSSLSSSSSKRIHFTGAERESGNTTGKEALELMLQREVVWCPSRLKYEGCLAR